MNNPLNRAAGAPITGYLSHVDLQEYADRLNNSGFSRANNWHWLVARRKIPGPKGTEVTQLFLDRRDALSETTK